MLAEEKHQALQSCEGDVVIYTTMTFKDVHIQIVGQDKTTTTMNNCLDDDVQDLDNHHATTYHPCFTASHIDHHLFYTHLPL